MLSIDPISQLFCYPAFSTTCNCNEVMRWHVTLTTGPQTKAVTQIRDTYQSVHESSLLYSVILNALFEFPVTGHHLGNQCGFIIYFFVCTSCFVLISFFFSLYYLNFLFSRKSLTFLGDREVGTENKLLVLACEDGLCVAIDVFSRSQVRKAWLQSPWRTIQKYNIFRENVREEVQFR